MYFTLQLMIPLTQKLRGASEGTFYGATKDVLSDLNKDAQECACEVALNGATEIAPEFHLWLHLLMQC